MIDNSTNIIQDYKTYKDIFYNSFTNKVQSSWLYIIFIAFGICIGIYYGPLLGFQIYYFLFNTQYSLLATLFIILGMPLFGFLGYYIPHISIRYWIIETITTTVHNYMDEIIILYLTVTKNIYQISTMDEVFKKIQALSLLFSRLKRIRRYIAFFDKENSAMFSHMQESDRRIIITIITDIITDLQLRLEEQKNSLEQAKSEVEKNIQGTTELEQVSELQKARLDRQIEQFEELQRILVTQ